MRYYAMMLDKDGINPCGTDAWITIDGRLSRINAECEAQEYIKRFEKHFPWKFASFRLCKANSLSEAFNVLQQKG